MRTILVEVWTLLVELVLALVVGCLAMKGVHAFFTWLSKPRFRVRCPDCDGTGLCGQPGRRNSHSCCGDCRRVWVPRYWVPKDFNGCERHGRERGTLPDDPATVHADPDDNYALIGCGWVPGSFWQRLRRGGPQPRLGSPPSLQKETA